MGGLRVLLPVFLMLSLGGCVLTPALRAKQVDRAVPAASAASAASAVAPERGPEQETRACWSDYPDMRDSDGGGKVWLLAAAVNSGELTHAEADARRIVRRLRQRFDLPAARVCVLNRATRSDIEAAFARLRGVAATDLVVFYFSGHGTKVADDENRDEASSVGSDPLEEVFVTADLDLDDPDLARVMRDDDFAAWVAALPSDNFLAVIDACFGADLSRGPVDEPLRPKFLSLWGRAHAASRSAEQVGGPDPVRGLLLSAAGGAQGAFEHPRRGGVFTDALVRVLDGERWREPRVDAWFDEVIEQVYAATGKRQTPFLGGDRKLWARWIATGSGYLRATTDGERDD